MYEPRQEHIRISDSYTDQMVIRARDMSVTMMKVPKKDIKVDPGFKNAMKDFIKHKKKGKK